VSERGAVFTTTSKGNFIECPHKDNNNKKESQGGHDRNKAVGATFWLQWAPSIVSAAKLCGKVVGDRRELHVLLQ